MTQENRLPSPPSGYENYDETARSYDQTRVPIGIEIIIGLFECSPHPLSEQVILDAGCGTGNYVSALKDRVGLIHGLEFNANMIAEVRIKLQTLTNVVLDVGSILEMPYEDNTFDGVLCNQVIHHLERDKETRAFTQLHRMMSEAYRVLRPKGVLIINTCSHRQLLNGFWWADLIPQAVEKVRHRCPTLEVLKTLLTEVGFCVGGVEVPFDAVLQGPSYWDPQGPLKKSWRNGDSTWSLTTAEELDRALEQVNTMHENNTIKSYLKAREAHRKQIGQTTFVYAHR